MKDRTGAPKDGACLVLQGLSKNFGGLHAVAHLDLQLFPGERRGILGPNGAGKTTLFNLITGVLPATSGKVLYWSAVT